MSRTRKILTLTTEEVEEIEMTTQISDPGELVVEYLQIEVLRLGDFLKEYQELKNAPEKIRVLARKRVALVAKKLGIALTAPNKPIKAVIDADEKQREYWENLIVPKTDKEQAPIIEC